MNWDQIKGNWHHVTSKARHQWVKLSDDDLEAVAARRDPLSGTLGPHHDAAMAHAEEPFPEWEDTAISWFTKR